MGRSISFANLRAVSALRRHGALVGLAIAVLAALYRFAIGSQLTNDDFSHLALSRQLLGGDVPIRDFVEDGITLTYGLSAAAQMLFGYRLLAETIIVAVAFFVGTYAVFAVVRTLTSSTIAAAFAAILLPLAGARGYGYPKILTYAVAALLWWWYVSKPSRRGAIALGVWAALSFSWRPDHGVYVAAGVVLAMVAAHGFRLATVTRTALSGATALALVLPFFVFVQMTRGLVPYALQGFSLAETHHTRVTTHAMPEWPLRRVSDVVQFAPAERYAPVVLVGWAAGTTPETRAAVLARHHLTVVEEDAGDTRVRLADPDTKAILALINDPAVGDTAGIDRSTASLLPETWSPWEQLRFRHGWMRLRVFAGLDDLNDAGEAAATLFFLLPVIVFAVLAPLRRHFAMPVTPSALLAFCVFATIVNLGILRTPYGLRTADDIVMPAILLGCLVGIALKVAAGGGRLRRVAMGCAVSVLMLFTLTATAAVGQFGERIDFLAGGWHSMTRMRAAWSDNTQHLVASPPLRYWDGVQGPTSIRFAQYASACVPPSDRLAVLWFAPETYYYADRLMAVRHLVFQPGLASPEEQKRSAEKFNRTAPPVVFAEARLWTYTRTMFPELVADIERDYMQVDRLDDDEGYLLLTRRNRTPTSTWGPRQWPCFR